MKPTRSEASKLVVSAMLMQMLYSTDAAISFVEWPVSSGGNGHYYGVTESATDWQTAENLAVSLGGHLASIASAAEQSFIENTLLVGTQADRPLWIGLTDRAAEGTFEWVTGEPLSFTKWKSGEPNNTSGNEHYAAMNWEHGRGGPLGTWNDCAIAGTSDYGAGTIGPYSGLIELTNGPVQPLILAIELESELNSVVLCWDTIATNSYQLEYISSFTTNMWAPLETPIQGTGSRTCIVDVVRSPQRFYRIQQLR